MKTFIASLNMRLGNEKNNALALSIFSSIMRYHDIPEIKKTALKAIDLNP